MKLLALVFFLFVGCLAAQSQPASGQQCAGGWLTAIQQDSISVRLNEKTTVFHLTPETEIWRRGKDLTDPHQLVVGDQLFVTCAGTAADGAPIAVLIGAAEPDDGLEMVPHHIRESRSCIGRLSAIRANTLSMKEDSSICTVHVTPETEIWRGEIFHNSNALVIGDDIDAVCIVSYPSGELIAETVWANLTDTEGVIAAVYPDRIAVNQYPGADRHSAYPRGHITVLIDSRTHFDDSTPNNLKKGAEIRAVGLELGPKKFRATNVHIYK